MWIVAVDTSWKQGGLALARGDARACEVVATAPIAGGTFSAQLVPQFADLLAQHGLTKHQVDGFAVASGPGSFTGLRVGLAAIKALAEILGKPIAAVSVLEAIALAAGAQGRVWAALDAGRGEIFLGEYEVRGQHATGRESLVGADAFAATLEGTRTVATPDTAVAELASGRGARVVILERPGADAIARIGLRKLLAGETVPLDELDANYLRRSDAEIFSKPR